VYFNPIFDALNKVSCRILFDILLPYLSINSLWTRSFLSRTAQSSLIAYSKIQLHSLILVKTELIVVPHPDDDGANAVKRRAFSLSRLIPLLSDRICST
jgi:hypothetical protein